MDVRGSPISTVYLDLLGLLVNAEGVVLYYVYLLNRADQGVCEIRRPSLITRRNCHDILPRKLVYANVRDINQPTRNTIEYIHIDYEYIFRGNGQRIYLCVIYIHDTTDCRHNGAYSQLRTVIPPIIQNIYNKTRHGFVVSYAGSRPCYKPTMAASWIFHTRCTNTHGELYQFVGKLHVDGILFTL